MPLVMRAL